MSACSTFYFGDGYILRPAGGIAMDRILARQWTQADPDHRDQVNSSFWLEQAPDRDSYLLLDSKGALFFWKGINLTHRYVPDAEHKHDPVEIYKHIEMHVQFPPAPEDPFEGERLRSRIRKGLTAGLAWLEPTLAKADVRQIYFESISPMLIRFCVQELGFTRDGNRVRKMISSGKENTNVR